LVGVSSDSLSVAESSVAWTWVMFEGNKFPVFFLAWSITSCTVAKSSTVASLTSSKRSSSDSCFRGRFDVFFLVPSVILEVASASVETTFLFASFQYASVRA
jgi:hypothetical protein